MQIFHSAISLHTLQRKVGWRIFQLDLFALLADNNKEFLVFVCSKSQLAKFLSTVRAAALQSQNDCQSCRNFENVILAIQQKLPNVK